MCPMCMTTAAVIAASTASGAGVLGFFAVKISALRRRRRERSTAQPAVSCQHPGGAGWRKPPAPNSGRRVPRDARLP
jgi:hypothetical protein